MSNRIIAIGDIHGCADEFEELLEKLAVSSCDRLVLLGDLVNRGPDSLRVLDIARRAGAIAILGNHEHRLRKYRHTRDLSVLKKEDYPTLSALRAVDWDFIEQMPITHHEPSIQTVYVHGGFLPSRPWSEQGEDIVTRIQVIDRQGRARKRADCPDGSPWVERWVGPPFVVYGHTPRPLVYQSPWALGIDTGCVSGGKLTAYVLPDKAIIQVDARATYYKA